MRHLLSFFLCITCFILWAESEKENTIDVSATEGLPSSIVNGVCVISGEYTTSKVDLVLPGPESLVFQRHYSSGLPGRAFGLGWGLNHDEDLYIETLFIPSEDRELYGDDKPYWKLSHFQSSGTLLTYEHDEKCGKRRIDDKYTHYYHRKIPFDLNVPRGLTNGAHTISGRTNLNNYEVDYYGSGHDCVEIKTGGGNYKIFHRLKNMDCDHYHLDKEKNPNGSEYEYHHHEKDKDLYHINCQSQKVYKLFSAIRIEKTPTHHHRFTKRLTTSDGRFIDYQFKSKPSKDKKKEDDLFLTEINSPYVLHEKFKYEENNQDKKPQLVKIERPDQRIQKINYYQYKDNEAASGKKEDRIYLKHKDDYRVNRVRSLEAPVGTGPELIQTHFFTYKCKVIRYEDAPHELKKGSTKVLDAYHNQTMYDYDKYHRLIDITRFTKEESKPYAHEKYFWSDRKGNLQGKVLTDGKGNIHHGKFYSYDKRGNVLKSFLCGALTGLPCSPILINYNNHPQPNKYEKEEITYTYTEDGLNLVETETDSQGVKTYYRYVPKKDLLEAKIIADESGVFSREFYEYTSEGILICKIVDNGNNLEDMNDLSNVTCRHITRCTHTQEIPYGLPAYVAESYLDLITGQENFLKGTISHYSMTGKLIRQDVLDSSTNVVYSLHWKYDDRGNIIEQSNALGETTFRSYDDNNNLVVEQLPNGTVINNIYDFSNRLIRQVEKHANGQTFEMSHCYDYLSQCLKTTDPFGNEKHQEYDEFGRLIRTTHPSIYNENQVIVQPSVQSEYNFTGQIKNSTDAKGNQTFYKYNIRNQPTEIIYPDQSVEKFIYRNDGQLLKKTEKNGNCIHYIRDQRGRLLGEHIYNEKNELLKGENHHYNQSHLLSTTDAEGLTTYFRYDCAGRLEWTLKGNQKKQTLYDEFGRIAEVREWVGEGEQEYTRALKSYDFLDRLIEECLETATGELLSLSKTQYDSQGNKIFVQVGDQITWTEYDGHNNPVKVTDALGQVTHTVYNTSFVNELGQRVLQTCTTDPLGYQTVQTYDAANHLVKVERKNPFDLLVGQQEICYDLAGNKVKVYDSVMEDGVIKRRIETHYHYDVGNRITAVIEASGTPEQKITHYGYHKDGQKGLLIKPDGVQIFYTYDDLGRLKSLKSSDHSIDYTYAYNRP